MLLDRDLYVAFNVPERQLWAVDGLVTAAAEHGHRPGGPLGRMLYVARPSGHEARGRVPPPANKCPAPHEAAPAGLAAASVPVVGVDAPFAAYEQGLATGAIGGDSDGPPVRRLTVDHWAGPMQRALVRHVLTQVAELRHRAGRSGGLPAPLSCR